MVCLSKPNPKEEHGEVAMEQAHAQQECLNELLMSRKKRNLNQETTGTTLIDMMIEETLREAIGGEEEETMEQEVEEEENVEEEEQEEGEITMADMNAKMLVLRYTNLEETMTMRTMEMISVKVIKITRKQKEKTNRTIPGRTTIRHPKPTVHQKMTPGIYQQNKRMNSSQN